MARLVKWHCWPTWAKSGWRKSALMNCIVLTVVLVLLTILSILSAVKGQSIMLPTLIFSGTCDDNGSAKTVKTVLGIFVNIISTGILGSSNFFMQVLNAPTREDVDKAHSRASWLDVGISSASNTFKMKRWKLAAWVLLAISSTPIHFLFNSTIFWTDNQRADYHITIASEDFINDGVYHAPGASLSPAGLYPWDFALYDNENLTWFDRKWFDAGYYWKTYEPADLPSTRFGGLRNLSEYLDQSSEAVRNISSTSERAGSWKKLDTTECRQIYGSCDGLRGYRDVVLITESPPAGWQPDQVWRLEENQTAFWESFMPLNESNSLWFSAQCVRYAVYNGIVGLICDDTCWHMTNKSTSPRVNSSITDLSFFQDTYDNYDDDANGLWERIYGDLSYVNGTSPLTSGLVPGAADLSAKYCLAETVDDFCHVGVSNILFICVVLCVLVKTGVAVAVLYRSIPGDESSTKPLVTVGDAIASFIEKPDPITFGLCTLNEMECNVIMDPILAQRTPLRETSNVLVGPRCWGTSPRRFWSVIPKSCWIRAYVVFFLVFSIAIGTMAIVDRSIYTQVSIPRIRRSSAAFVKMLACFPQLWSCWKSQFPLTRSGCRLNQYGTESASVSQGYLVQSYTFIAGVLISNSPQMVLVLVYLCFNNLITRIQNAKEWASFGSNWEPLRVTDPE